MDPRNGRRQFPRAVCASLIECLMLPACLPAPKCLDPMERKKRIPHREKAGQNPSLCFALTPLPDAGASTRPYTYVARDISRSPWKGTRK